MKGHPSGWSFLFTLIQLYIRYGIFVNIEKNELHTIHMNRYSSLFIREYFCAPAEGQKGNGEYHESRCNENENQQ